MTCNTGSN